MSDESKMLSYAMMTTETDEVLQYTGKGWKRVSVREAQESLVKLQIELRERLETHDEPVAG